ncbi:MAG: hypothetical protein AB7R55_08160 [Gemmatimonadales bacterium]
MNPGDVAPMIVVTTMMVVGGLALVLRGPIGRALAKRLEGHSPASDERVLDLEARIAELERDRDELHERVEFAERLLARTTEAARELR